MKMDSVSLKEIMSFFGMSASEFMKEWKKFTDKDKADLKNGIGSGTLNY